MNFLNICDIKKDFLGYYNRGFDEFHFGDWSLAKKLLEKTLKYKKVDKPTKNIGYYEEI